jgi:hypothetical protein
MVAGVSHWRFGNFSLFRVNPPLTRLIATLPVVALTPNTDWHRASTDLTIRSEWVVGEDFIVANQNRAMSLFIVARYVCIPLSLLGAWVCGRWASQLYGRASGYLAMALWCFCPSILAHAQMIGPDASAAAFGVAACYVFWKWLHRPSWKNASVAGFVLGLAELTKLTWIVLFFLWPIVWGVWRWGGTEDEGMKRPTFHEGRTTEGYCQIGIILLLAIYSINLGYGFEGTFQRLGDYEFVSRTLAGPSNANERPTAGQNCFSGTYWGGIPIPFPKNYLMGIDRQKWDFERGLPSYLRGEWSDRGWWYYYFYSLALKEPLGTWLLLVLAISVTVFGRGYSAPRRDEMMVLVPGLVLLMFVSSQTGFSVHSRYVIPALPFLFVWMSKVAKIFEMRPFTGRRLAMVVTVVAAVFWSVSSSLSVYPHCLSYFNELAAVLPTTVNVTHPTPRDKSQESILSRILTAGPRNGPRHLLDSNIDWGQDLFYLESWYESHLEARPIRVAYFGGYPLDQSKIRSAGYPPTGLDREQINEDRDATTFGPLPGWYALSVNEVFGRSQQYRYFLHFEPLAMAGYSIYIYHITLDKANRVRRELGMSELPKDWQPRDDADDAG